MSSSTAASPWRSLFFRRRDRQTDDEKRGNRPGRVERACDASECECASLRAENRRLKRILATDGQAFEARLIEAGDMFIAQQADIRAKDHEITQLRVMLKRTQAALRQNTIGDSDTGLALRLRRSMMHAAGLTAQLDLMQEQHPDSPWLDPTGESFEDGQPKTHLRVAYERAYEAYSMAHPAGVPQALKRR